MFIAGVWAMFFSRGTKTKYGNEITLEYAENWNEKSLLDNQSKEAFFQTLLDYLCLYASDLNIYHFQLLSIAKAKDHYKVQANEKDKDNIVMLKLPYHSNTDKAAEIQMYLFNDWETKCKHLVEKATTSFNEVRVETEKTLLQLKNNTTIFTSQTFKLQPWLDKDVLANKTITKITQINASILEKLNTKTAQLNTLKLRLESLAYDFHFNYAQQNLLNIQKDFETSYLNVLHNEYVEICEAMYFCNDKLRHLKKIIMQFGNYAGIRKEILSQESTAEHSNQIANENNPNASLESLVNAENILPDKEDYDRSIFQLS